VPFKSPSEDHPLKQGFFLALRAKRSIDEKELAKVAVRLSVGFGVILAVGVGGFIALFFILCLLFIICGNCCQEKAVDAGRPKQKAEASRTKLANNKAVEYV